MLAPSAPDLKVIGVFNPAAVQYGGGIALLLRVAEAVADVADGEAAVPVYDPTTGRIEIKRFQLAAGVDASDPRVLVVDGETLLTSLSHFRIARANDGVRFEIEQQPALFAATPYEAFGIEDARITMIESTYWINYTAASSLGIATALASTTDFRSFARHGIIFPPNNRDVTIFPEKINGQFVALHRPMPAGLGEPAIWVATSPDLLRWGDHRVVATARGGCWDDAKIGAGAVPFRVQAGGADAWLAIYHGVSSSPYAYALGALLLDARDPARVIARSREPILRPETAYERAGFFGSVVFTCGALRHGDHVRIYYGAADTVTAVADIALQEILGGLDAP